MLREGTTLVIGNPTAKTGSGAAASEQSYKTLRDALGTEAVNLVLTKRAGHAVSLAAGAAGTYNNIVVVGGDGVIHEAANGLMQLERTARPTLGIVPVGSGNDYAQTLGMSTVVEDALEQLLSATTQPMDVGCVNGEYFVETLSFGLDAAIALGTVEARKHSSKTGGALYFEVGIDQLLHHLNTYQVEAVLDGGRSFATPAIMFAVQIGVTYGGGFKICPNAKPNDGIFDICYATPVSVPRAVFTFARAKGGHHTGARPVHFEQARELVLRFNVEPPCQADGEKVTGTEFHITMHPHALDVLIPS